MFFLNAPTTPVTSTSISTAFLDYLWVPIFVPAIIALIKFIFIDKLLYVKEVKRITDRDIERFIELYNERIDESLRICVEEILQFVGQPRNSSIEHHLYLCKKIDKAVGFMKFMISKEHKYIFVAYVAIDKKDKAALEYGMKTLNKKLARKYFNKDNATCIITEVEESDNGSHRNAMSLLVSRYAKSLGKKCYYVDIPYIQPHMPDDHNKQTEEQLLALLYIPYYDKANNCISRAELLSILESIYFDIYAPSCDPTTGCDCDAYNQYLSKLLAMYQDSNEYVKLIPIGRQN